MDKLTIGILGAFQNGKSTLVNCLLGKKVAQTGGYGINVTSINTKYIYGETSGITIYDHENLVGQYSFDSIVGEGSIQKHFNSVSITDIIITLPTKILSFINILDTPGFNANEHDDIMALESLNNLDVAILLIKNKGLNEIEKTICQELYCKGIPFFLVMNCMDECDDMWNPSVEQNYKIANNILSELKLHGISPYPFGGEQIWITNLLWYWHSICNTHYSEVEQKQAKRIINFFDLFLNCSQPSRNHLKGKSCFIKLSKALQHDKNLFALNLFVLLSRNFEYYRKSVFKKCCIISRNVPTIISKEIMHLQECICDNRMKYKKNRVLIKNKKKELTKIEAESSYDFSSLDNLVSRILCGTWKYGAKQLKLMIIRAKISASEQENKDLLTLEKTYQEFIQYLHSIKLPLVE